MPAVVYLKNRITKGWAPIENDQSRFKAVPEGDKQVIRARLVPILAASPPQIRAQLVATLQKILHYDFPEQWPDFLNITVNLLNQQDAGSVFAGLQCLLAICRVYRFKMGETREDFDKIVEMSGRVKLTGPLRRLRARPTTSRMRALLTSTSSHSRLLNSAPLATMMMTTSWKRSHCLKLLWIRWSRMACSSTHFSVS